MPCYHLQDMSSTFCSFITNRNYIEYGGGGEQTNILAENYSPAESSVTKNYEQGAILASTIYDTNKMLSAPYGHK